MVWSFGVVRRLSRACRRCSLTVLNVQVQGMLTRNKQFAIGLVTGIAIGFLLPELIVWYWQLDDEEHDHDHFHDDEDNQ